MVLFHEPVSALGIHVQWFMGIFLPPGRQEMVIEDVDNDGGVMTVRRPKSCFAQFDSWVFVREFIDRAMEFDSTGNTFAELRGKVPATDKVADEIPDHHLGIVAGQMEVGEKIHAARYTLVETKRVVGRLRTVIFSQSFF